MARSLIAVYREALLARHYARRTIATYERWLRRYLHFHRLRHPREMGGPQINTFLTPPPALVSGLLYWSGLRLMEALSLRVQDLDFAAHQLLIRVGKGNKDRVTVLPQNLMDPLQMHLQGVRRVHRQDLAAGWGPVPLPNALNRKYPTASREWVWQWVFPQVMRWRNRETGEQGRHHLDPSVIQRAVRASVRAAGISKPARDLSPLLCHIPAGARLRHSGSTRMCSTVDQQG